MLPVCTFPFFFWPIHRYAKYIGRSEQDSEAPSDYHFHQICKPKRRYISGIEEICTFLYPNICTHTYILNIANQRDVKEAIYSSYQLTHNSDNSHTTISLNTRCYIPTVLYKKLLLLPWRLRASIYVCMYQYISMY